MQCVLHQVFVGQMCKTNPVTDFEIAQGRESPFHFHILPARQIEPPR
jgi:hypothetical protein